MNIHNTHSDSNQPRQGGTAPRIQTGYSPDERRTWLCTCCGSFLMSTSTRGSQKPWFCHENCRKIPGSFRNSCFSMVSFNIIITIHEPAKTPIYHATHPNLNGAQPKRPATAILSGIWHSPFQLPLFQRIVFLLAASAHQHLAVPCLPLV
jgi:hypothetical protein